MAGSSNRPSTLLNRTMRAPLRRAQSVPVLRRPSRAERESIGERIRFVTHSCKIKPVRQGQPARIWICRAIPAPPRHRSASTPPLLPARAYRQNSAPDGEGTARPGIRNDIPFRLDALLFNIDDAKRFYRGFGLTMGGPKCRKSCRPIKCRAPSRIAATSSSYLRCHTKPLARATGARRETMRYR